MPYTYRKNERLRKNSEFVAAMKGKRLSSDGLSLFYAPNDRGNFRVGISVGKKLAAGAVDRNRIRRRLRDSISRSLHCHQLGYDLVFVARPGILGADHGRTMKVVESLLRKTVLSGAMGGNSGR